MWGAEPRFELGPAIQQAVALLSEPRRTLIEFLIGIFVEVSGHKLEVCLVFYPYFSALQIAIHEQTLVFLFRQFV
jgi:hypothetical protein